MSAAPVAVFGGTFDPVHLGHLRVAWEASEALDAQVRMIPANVPPHREQPVASAADRVALLRCALAGQQRLVLDTREMRRDGPSYTVDTLRDMRAEIGDDVPLILLLGADACADLAAWHEWRTLFSLAHILVLTRPGSLSPDAIEGEVGVELARRRVDSVSTLRSRSAGAVAMLSVSALDISASQVRDCFARGGEPRYLLPEVLLDRVDLLQSYRSV